MVFQQKGYAALGRHCWGKPLVKGWGWDCTAVVVSVGLAVVAVAAAAAVYSPSEFSGALKETTSD